MPTEISIRASDPGSSSRAFPWPVLEAGNASYENGIYSVGCEDQTPGESFFLHHSVKNAPLLEKWVESGQITFVCTVAAPRSMYRTLQASSDPEQLVRWDPADLGEHPMFTPMLVARGEISHVVDAETDGLSQIWHDKELHLPKGARVAVGPTFKFQSGISGILDFSLHQGLNPGQFRVQDSSEDGFKFKVYLAADLFQHLRYHRRELVSGNIMVHIVSAALGILKRDYATDDDAEGWKSYHNLVGLAELLEAEGLGHWADDDFRPEEAATHLYPHRLSEGTEP